LATLFEMVEEFKDKNPNNMPTAARRLAEIWWPDASWLKHSSCRHNGGPKKGALVAAGFARRLEHRGLLQSSGTRPTLYTWINL